MTDDCSCGTICNAKTQGTPSRCPRSGRAYPDQTEAPMPDAVNPKQLCAVADGKAPLEYLEPAGDAETALVMKHGADKYGLRNYTVTPINTRTYIGAVARHLRAIRLGEDVDPDSGHSHWAHIRACCDVVFGAQHAGTLVDDRAPQINGLLAGRGNSEAWHRMPGDGLDELAEEMRTVEPFVVQARCCFGGSTALDRGCVPNADSSKPCWGGPGPMFPPETS